MDNRDKHFQLNMVKYKSNFKKHKKQNPKKEYEKNYNRNHMVKLNKNLNTEPFYN